MLEFNDKQIQILEIAEKEFANNGFDGTSIRQISKVANMNVAMVSYYFGSKEKLLESLIVYKTNDFKIIFERIFNEKLDPFKKIEKFIDYYIEKIDNNRDFYNIIIFEMSLKKRSMDFESFVQIKKSNIESLEKIITEGQDLNIFKKDIQTTLIIPTIIGTYLYFQLNKSFLGNIIGLKTEQDYDNYTKKELKSHIHQTIKSLIII